MINLHDVLTAVISGVAEYKNEKEIWWLYIDKRVVTVEIIDPNTGSYIVREYYSNGNKCWESNYVNNKPQGNYTEWGEDGNTEWEQNYMDGKKHGQETMWDPAGNIIDSVMWENGVPVEE